MSKYTLKALKARFNAKGMTLEEAAYIAGELLQENAELENKLEELERTTVDRIGAGAIYDHYRRLLEEKNAELQALRGPLGPEQYKAANARLGRELEAARDALEKEKNKPVRIRYVYVDSDDLGP